MIRDETKRALVIPALLAALVLGAPAFGDLLVTRDGSRIETRGPWEVRGRLVVFTQPDGTLASIRLREVDLEASEDATAAAEEKETEKGAEGVAESGESAEGAATEKEATWVLTDADFTRRLVVDEETEASEEGTDDDGEDESSQSEAARPPVVLSYQEEPDVVDQHVRIVGTLANKTRTTASSVSLEVSLFDEQGNLLEMRRAEVTDTVLTPGAETSFQADFPDVFTYSAVRFRPKSVNLDTNEGEGARIPGPDDDAREEEELGTDEPPVG